MEEQIRIPRVYRGGTSKAVFVKENDLPRDLAMRDAMIRAIMGAGDKREINGLGGADLLTSKFAIIGPPSRADADIDYTFAQVGIKEPWVSYELKCGNISAATGPYAIEEGLSGQSNQLQKLEFIILTPGGNNFCPPEMLRIS
jgi:2-methylaconitate cis-trans-isomerase PrpF